MKTTLKSLEYDIEDNCYITYGERQTNLNWIDKTWNWQFAETTSGITTDRGCGAGGDILQYMQVLANTTKNKSVIFWHTFACSLRTYTWSTTLLLGWRLKIKKIVGEGVISFSTYRRWKTRSVCGGGQVVGLLYLLRSKIYFDLSTKRHTFACSLSTFKKIFVCQTSSALMYAIHFFY